MSTEHLFCQIMGLNYTNYKYQVNINIAENTKRRQFRLKSRFKFEKLQFQLDHSRARSKYKILNILIGQTSCLVLYHPIRARCVYPTPALVHCQP